jgi:hypothetical protein
MPDAPITHRCGRRLYETTCEAVRRADGTIEGNALCGEPCDWVMGKAGHGTPPWQTVDGMRRDPSTPDPGFEH